MIILTGASGGIGKKIVTHLVKIDNVLGIYNKSLPSMPAIRPNNKLVYERLNIENSNDIKSFIRKIRSRLSKVTVVHLAALKIDGLVCDYPEADWDRVMGVNLRGNFLLTQALLPFMISERWGRIIHISSRGGCEGDVGTISYSASKTGLIGMSRVLTKEYAGFNITSNILALGYFEVGLYNKLNNNKKKALLNQIPSKTFGIVSNIANAVEFLIKSEYVNGAIINIDGGM